MVGEDIKDEAGDKTQSDSKDASSEQVDETGNASQSTPNASQYPYSSEGYYAAGYPAAGAEGAAAGYPRGYEGGVPPYMAGYPPMPYAYQHHMYPHYPGYPPQMYGYPQPEGGYRDDQGAGAGPYHSSETGVASGAQDNGEESKTAEKKAKGAAIGTAHRLKTYIKPRIPSSQDVLDRRSRKNAQSRARAAKLRERIAAIEQKPEVERTEEEKQLFAQYEGRRQRKNDRSRERALEKKEEIDRILAKPEKKRSKIEKQFLEGALSAKKRKNEGDRLRRQRLKELGLSAKAVGLKPGISARGPMQPYRGMPPHPYGAMGEIPMSPMPPMGAQHPMQSPEGYAAATASPGMGPNVGYPSPQPASQTGVIETPGRSDSAPLPYIPGQQGYDAQSRVAQRRHPDGSMSISIGGETGMSSENHEMSDLLPHEN